MDLKEKIIARLKKEDENLILETSEFRSDFAIIVPAEKIVDVAKILKEDEELAFNLIEDVTAIDWARRKNRFTVVYHIYSLKNNFRIRIKVNLQGEEIPSVTSVWSGANWYERETYDMYGINFTNHPDLRRMYMPEEFEYYPLRKEFPLRGIPGSLPLPEKNEQDENRY
jgi:NADH-quinone oxidoreductase subunit C